MNITIHNSKHKSNSDTHCINKSNIIINGMYINITNTNDNIITNDNTNHVTTCII